MFFVSCVSHAFASVHCCLVVTCWERADLLALLGDVYCIFVTFPCGILGQVWYLIVSFPDHGLQSRPPSPKRAKRKGRRRPFREAGSGHKQWNTVSCVDTFSIISKFSAQNSKI